MTLASTSRNVDWSGRICATLLMLVAPGFASARSLTMSADRITNDALQASGVRIAIADRGPAASLSLHADRIEVPALALAGAIEWQCELAPADAGARSCSGPVELVDDGTKRRANLSARVFDDRVALDLDKDTARAGVVVPFGQGIAVKASLHRVPAAWLRAPLATIWNGTLRSGVVDADATIADGDAAEIAFSIDGLSLSGSDGALSTDGVAARGTLTLTAPSGAAAIAGSAALTAGALRFGDVRIALPDHPVQVTLATKAAEAGRWSLEKIVWNDPDALAFTASGVFAPSAADPLPSLSVDVEHAALPAAIARYAGSFLDANGIARPTAKGAISGHVEYADRTLESASLRLDDVDFELADVSVQGVDGALDWSADGDRPATTFAWKRATIDGLRLGAASTRVRTRDGRIETLKPVRLAIAGGHVAIERLAFDPRLDRGLSAEAKIGAEGLGYDSADGSIAAAGVGGEATLHLDGTLAAPRVKLDASLAGGEFLYGEFYAKLPDHGIAAALDARREGSTWIVDDARWRDPGVLELAGSARIDPDAAHPLEALDIETAKATLAPALARYAKSWLGAHGFADISAGGSVSASLDYGANGLGALRVDADHASLRDGAGRFAFDDVDGAIEWRYGGGAPPGRIRWSAIDLWRLPLGSGSAAFDDVEGGIALASPISVDVLGGKVKLERLLIQPRSPVGDRYAASFSIAGIDMGQLSGLLGWPKFGGNLSGGIPEVEFVGDTIALKGGLDLYVFDGYLGVSGMKLERPFGVAPALAADVHFENFDLEKLTSAFSFGTMTGRLDGNIRGLRLVNWVPVELDAALRANKGGRMSYKAVNDLTALGGGGGMSGGLQAMALKLFDTFGYSRLGLRCVLRAEVCEMGGIAAANGEPHSDSDASGYTIVEGSGVPRIEIIGHRRRVDWPVLVRRLVEATEGQGPVVR